MLNTSYMLHRKSDKTLLDRSCKFAFMDIFTKRLADRLKRDQIQHLLTPISLWIRVRRSINLGKIIQYKYRYRNRLGLLDRHDLIFIFPLPCKCVQARFRRENTSINPPRIPREYRERECSRCACAYYRYNQNQCNRTV